MRDTLWTWPGYSAQQSKQGKTPAASRYNDTESAALKVTTEPCASACPARSIAATDTITLLNS
jgi:hypothetical protein